MAKSKLAVGMAVYADYDGVFYSVSALRMYQDMQDVEIIILDNDPESKHGQAVANFVASIQNHCDISYHPFTENTGTTQTRERLFKIAKAPVLLCMDSHVLLEPELLKNLKDFWESATPEQKLDMYTGPLWYDNLENTSSHFSSHWRSEMWGIWAQAWRDPHGVLFESHNIDNELHMRHLNTDLAYMRSGIPWAGHEKQLREKGFVLASEGVEPFEVPGQGLGMFISSTENWIGFNPHFRGFGGEEMYVHTKLRQAGRKTLCLPWAKWQHKFTRVNGVPYPISREGKIRNYVLGFNELGKDLEEVRHHFVDEMGTKQDLFDLIVSDPINFNPKNNKFYREIPNTNLQNSQPEFKSNLGMSLPLVSDNLHTMATLVAGMPRDLDQHAEVLMRCASMCSSVAEITIRRESTLFLLAGITRKQACAKNACKKESCDNSCKGNVILDSWQAERDTLLGLIMEAVKVSPGKPVTYTDNTDVAEGTPDWDRDYDMVFLDTSTGSLLQKQLAKYSGRVGKFIAVHDTQVFGMKGSDGLPGHVPVLKGFLKNNPEWFISYHTDKQYGLTVLSKDESLRPPLTIQPWPKTTDEGLACGVGQEIKKMLKMIGIVATDNCPCNALAKKYDAMGPLWCRDNIDEILDALKEQAESRKMGHLFVRMAVKLMVMRAIRAAEKQIVNGQCA